MANTKRSRVEKMILDTVKLMEPEGSNHNRYKELFASMSDAEFDRYMKELKEGKRNLPFFSPNMKTVLKMADLKKAAEYIGAEVFTRVTFTDRLTGITYTTPYKGQVLVLPVRRTRQFLTHGLSVPEGNRKTDSLTGQVMKPNQASKFSFVEMQILHGRTMPKTLSEFMKIRGGDVHAYNEFRQQLEETGEFSQSSLAGDTVSRTPLISSLVLKCMGLDNNQIENKEAPR